MMHTQVKKMKKITASKIVPYFQYNVLSKKKHLWAYKIIIMFSDISGPNAIICCHNANLGTQ